MREDSQSPGVTCSVLLRELYDYYNPANDLDKLRVMMAFFWAGQAEKIKLGACKAAMFRPDFQKHPWVMEEIPRVASHYSLVHSFLPTSYGGEIWIARPENQGLIQELFNLEEDSQAWHEHRARLCGIPEEEIDRQFHLRTGRKVHMG